MHGKLLQADIDNNGTIDYGEFLAATLHLNKMEREDNLVAAFSYFDKDGSGYITIDELQQACKDFGLGDLHLDETIKEIDLDNGSLHVYIWSTSNSFTCLYNPISLYNLHRHCHYCHYSCFFISPISAL